MAGGAKYDRAADAVGRETAAVADHWDNAVAESFRFGEPIQDPQGRDDQPYLLQKDGKTYSFHEWVTIKEYTKRFNLKSTNVVSNWIKRGIIPEENIADPAGL